MKRRAFLKSIGLLAAGSTLGGTLGKAVGGLLHARKNTETVMPKKITYTVQYAVPKNSDLPVDKIFRIIADAKGHILDCSEMPLVNRSYDTIIHDDPDRIWGIQEPTFPQSQSDLPAYIPSLRRSTRSQGRRPIR